jgi:hypothetical protein
MATVLGDIFTGAALLVCALVLAILLIPVLVILSVFFHVISWFLSVALSILLFIFVLWGLGFLYRKAREASKIRKQTTVH